MSRSKTLFIGEVFDTKKKLFDRINELELVNNQYVPDSCDGNGYRRKDDERGFDRYEAEDVQCSNFERRYLLGNRFVYGYDELKDLIKDAKNGNCRTKYTEEEQKFLNKALKETRKDIPNAEIQFI